MKPTRYITTILAILILQGCTVYKPIQRDYQRQDLRIYPDIENQGIRVMIRIPSRPSKTHKF